MQNLHVRKKSHMADFWKKIKNYRIHCCVAHIIQTNPLFELFEFLDAQKKGFGAR